MATKTRPTRSTPAQGSRIQIPAPAGTDAHIKRVVVPPTDLALQLNPNATGTVREECSYCEYNLTLHAQQHGGSTKKTFCPRCSVKFGEAEKGHCHRCGTAVNPGLNCEQCGAIQNVPDEEKIATIKSRFEDPNADITSTRFKRDVRGLLADPEGMAEARKEANKNDWLKKAKEGTLYSAYPFAGSPVAQTPTGQQQTPMNAALNDSPRSMPTPTSTPMNILVASAAADEDCFKDFFTYTAGLRNTGMITVTSSREWQVGNHQQNLYQRVVQCQAVLVMTSADALNDKDFETVIQHARNMNKLVIALPIRHAMVDFHPFLSALSPLLPWNEPLQSSNNKGKTWVEVLKSFRQMIGK